MDVPGLVTRAQSGDENARGELLHLAARLVYARAFRLVGAGPGAEDLAQEALLAALGSLPRLREPRAFIPWLRRITDNVFADHVEGRRRAPAADQARVQAIPAVGADPAARAERAEELDRVRAALRALAPKNRLAIELFYFHELTCREVAEFLRISHDAARATLARSRKELQRRLATMTSTKRQNPRSICQVVSGASTFQGGTFQHDSDTEKLYMALYPQGEAQQAAATCHQQGRYVFDFLHRTIDAHLSNHPAPSLVSA